MTRLNPWEIEDILKTMIILVDTREQESERASKRYMAFGCPYRKQKLDYGDYTFSFFYQGTEYIEEKGIAKPKIVIERKESLTELSGNLCQQRDRFHREFERAKAEGAKIYLLVENASWEHLWAGHYGTKFHPNAYAASLFSIMANYNIVPIFCKQEVSGKMIYNILFREFKAMLERGDFDSVLGETLEN